MDVESKVEVMKSFAQEVITEDELRQLFETNDHPIAYDGFEPSGVAPIHFGLLRAHNLARMLKIGIKPKLYLADYFAFVNNKFEGNLDHIRTAGRYFAEVWKACGINTDRVEIIWAKDLMDSIEYWDRFMRVGKATTLDRVKRAVTIMGRTEGDKLSAAQLFYPCMQVTDIFQMEIDICQLGIDQRRANILAREVADRYKWKKPVVVSHPLMLGLQGMPAGSNIADLKSNPDLVMEYKMSKSKPKSAIYMHDSYEGIKSKINSAYCPERVVEGNPLFNFLELALIEDRNAGITIERPQKFGGNLEVDSFESLKRAYMEGRLHPADLKSYVTEKLEIAIRPVREHFEKNAKAKELYDEVRGYQITR